MNDSRKEVCMVLERYGFFSGGSIHAFASDADVEKMRWYANYQFLEGNYMRTDIMGTIDALSQS